MCAQIGCTQHLCNHGECHWRYIIPDIQSSKSTYVNAEVMRQVALAPRLAYSRQLLEETTVDLARYIQKSSSRPRHPESERILLFCLEVARRAETRLQIHNMDEIPGMVPPAIWALRAASAQISDHLPECSARLSELAVHLGSIAMDAALLARVDIRYRGSESVDMLDSADAAAEIGLRKIYPEIKCEHTYGSH